MSKFYTIISTVRVFTIANFDEYKEFKKEWKENYKILSDRIRQVKVNRKDPNAVIRSSAQSERETLRILARKEMELLAEAKDHAAMLSANMKEEVING